MSRRSIMVFAAAAALLLVGGLWLLRGVDSPEPTAGSGAPSPRAAARAAEPRNAAVPNLPATTAAPSGSVGAAPKLVDEPMKWRDADLSKRSVVQREDDSIPRSKDAPPPVFKTETLQAIRAAATPGVEKCKTDVWKTYPDLAANPEIKASISVVYTASAAAGAITIPTARVVINGFADDTYATCVREVFEKLQVQSPAGQSDGKGQVSSSFIGKD